MGKSTKSMKEKEIEERTSGKMGYYRHRLGEREKIKIKGDDRCSDNTTPLHGCRAVPQKGDLGRLTFRRRGVGAILPFRSV